MNRIDPLAVLVAFVLPALAEAQTPTRVVQAPSPITELLGVHAAQVQDLLLPPIVGEELTVQVNLDGAMRTLQLHACDIRSADFELLVDDGMRLTRIPTPPSVTYRGILLGESGSAVAATVRGGELRALMRRGDELWTLQPVSDAMPGLALGSYAVYEQQAVIDLPFGCVVPDDAPIPATSEPSGSAAAEDGALTVADLAVDADFPFYTARSSSVIEVHDDITDVLNAMDVIYNADVGIEHRVVTIIVRTAPLYTANGHALLTEYQNQWITSHFNINRDITHLFTGRAAEISVDGVLAGTALPASICSTLRGYGVSWSDYYPSLPGRVGITGHEMGHSWGAIHCDPDSDCFLMCSQLGGCAFDITRFGSRSQADIAAFKASLPCLSLDTDPSPAPTISALNPPSVVTFAPALVIMNGANLDTVTSVTVAGMPVAFTAVTADSLRFTPPAMLDIQAHQVAVSNSTGSASMDLLFTGVHPSQLDFPNFVSRGVPATYRIRSDREWQGALGISLSNVPSIIPGVINLSLGNNFLNLIVVPVFADTTGTVEFELAIPDTIPFFTSTYWQAVMFSDPFNLTLPLQPSPMATVRVL